MQRLIDIGVLWIMLHSMALHTGGGPLSTDAEHSP
jgi:hypothetical protein